MSPRLPRLCMPNLPHLCRQSKSELIFREGCWVKPSSSAAYGSTHSWEELSASPLNWSRGSFSAGHMRLLQRGWLRSVCASLSCCHSQLIPLGKFNSAVTQTHAQMPPSLIKHPLNQCLGCLSVLPPSFFVVFQRSCTSYESYKCFQISLWWSSCVMS